MNEEEIPAWPALKISVISETGTHATYLAVTRWWDGRVFRRQAFLPKKENAERYFGKRFQLEWERIL